MLSKPMIEGYSFSKDVSIYKCDDLNLPKVTSMDRPYESNFSLKQLYGCFSETNLIYQSSLIKRLVFSLMSKRFLILSGLAGSGKTQLALAFSEAIAEDDAQICVVAVGADWTNREPLLGYPNALKEGEYVKPESGVLDLLIEANANPQKPYFLILDEMNLSYVERYFADFLSAMESGKSIKLWSTESEKIPSEIVLPSNLYIIGTINVDETTYMFSPKVLDRANVIEFNITPEDMDNFLKRTVPVDRSAIRGKASNMAADFITKSNSADMYTNENISAKLLGFFNHLKNVNAEFGYRTASEMMKFIHHALNDDDTEDNVDDKTVLDWAIVQKLLPKLHGSRRRIEPVLKQLWSECFDTHDNVPQIEKANIEYADYPLTADKIWRMFDSAVKNGFTSFSEA